MTKNLARARRARNCGVLAVIALTVMSSAPGVAHACMVQTMPDPEDVRHADIVVVGQISNYEIILDEAFRRKKLSRPDLSPQLRAHHEEQKGVLSDYARFDIHVDEVLHGEAQQKLTVTWDNSTFAEPKKMAAGPFLIALRDPGSARPLLKGPSATILPNLDPEHLTVLQAPCSNPFIFDDKSDDASTIRQILSSDTR